MDSRFRGNDVLRVFRGAHKAQHLASACFLMGADLEEFRPKHWHGSGELHPHTVEVLEKSLPKLTQTMIAIAETLEHEDKGKPQT